MIAETASTDIESIEELTLFSLDRSQDGLRDLIQASGHCADLLRNGASSDGIRHLAELADQLHALEVFEHNVSSLFRIDRSRIRDRNGDLGSATHRFRESLHRLSDCLAAQEITQANTILADGICASLVRFMELFPVLREYIDREYAMTMR